MIGIGAFYAKGVTTSSAAVLRPSTAPHACSLRPSAQTLELHHLNPGHLNPSHLAPVPRESSVTKPALRVAAPWLLVNRP